MKITEFLLARIAEDEAEARDASHQKIAGPFHGNWRADSLHLVSMERADAIHIARHDPARVLRECAAKRAIIDIHLDRDGDCARCSDYAWFAILDGGEHEEFPCPTIRALAAVYTDHQDYRPEWAPQQ